MLHSLNAFRFYVIVEILNLYNKCFNGFREYSIPSYTQSKQEKGKRNKLKEWKRNGGNQRKGTRYDGNTGKKYKQ